MNCPRCKVQLVDTYTPKGIVVDYCPRCQGIWFDKGELNYYSKSPASLSVKLRNGLIAPHEGTADCPRCSVRMIEGGLLKEELQVDQCPSCEGIWLDSHELTRLQEIELSSKGLDPSKFFSRNYTGSTAMEELTGQKITGARRGESFSGSSQSSFDGSAGRGDERGGKNIYSGSRAPRIPLPKLPSLVFRSIGTFVVLYGMLGVIMIILAEAGLLSTGAAVISTLIIIAINYAISPFIMDFFLRWAQRLEWYRPEELPAEISTFIKKICDKEGIPFPYFGIIDDGTPNAFTYGHIPRNARVVVTRGLIEKLEPEEVNAVIAHELGHAVHWDILLMTMASMVPIILYYISRTLLEMRSSDRNDRNPLPLIGVIAYIMYVISEYIVLFLSRTREYWADRYSALVTNNPNALARALIKIAYGLAGQAAEEARAAKAAGQEVPVRNRALAAMGTLGIFDATSAKGLVATSAGSAALTADSDTEISRENIVNAMQWDLWNPWGLYYELHSTHPLPASRIEALSRTALVLGQTPYIVFDRKKPESYWDDFFVDLTMKFLPLIGFIAGLGLGNITGLNPFGTALAACGVGYLALTLFSYPAGSFPEHSIASLLKYVKVSGVRPVPATIRGRIIGKGIPGLVWSEDLTLQDKTGYIFLDYEQPLAIFNFIFGLRNDRFIGSEVTATGWYRRAPVPYFELYRLHTFEGEKTCYVRIMKIVFSVILTLSGLWLAFVII